MCKRVLLSAVVLAAIAVLGCSGDDATESDSGQPGGSRPTQDVDWKRVFGTEPDDPSVEERPGGPDPGGPDPGGPDPGGPDPGGPDPGGAVDEVEDAETTVPDGPIEAIVSVGPPVVASEPVPDPDSGQELCCTWRVALDLGDERVDAVAFSPDGTLLAGIGDDNVRLWDLKTGEVKHSLKKQSRESAVEDLAFSPDGKMLAWTEQTHVRLWDFAEKQLRTLPNPEPDTSSFLESWGFPLYVAFSRDSSRLVSLTRHGGSDDPGDVLLWSLPEGELLAAHRGVSRFHAGCAIVALSPDGTTLATTSQDNTISLVDAETGAERASLIGHTKKPKRVAFSPDGKTLASYADNDTVIVWDAKTGDRKQTLEFSSPWLDLAFSPSGNTLAIGERSLSFYNLETGKLGTRRQRLPEFPAFLAFSPDGNAIASVGFEEYEIRIWDLHVSRQERTLTPEGNAYRVAISPDGRTIAVARDELVEIRDFGTGEKKRTIQLEAEETAFSPDGKTLAIYESEDESKIRLYNVEDGEVRDTLETGAYLAVNLPPEYAPGGRALAIADEKEIQLWGLEPIRKLSTLKGHWGDVTCLAFSPDGGTLASGAWDATARLWDTRQGQLRATLEAHEGRVTSVAFSPNGKTLLSSGYDHCRARLWDVATGEEMRTFEHRRESGPSFTVGGYTDHLLAACFSPDGKSAVTVSPYWIRIWDTKTAEGRFALTAYGTKTWGATTTFSADRTAFVTLGDDGLIRLWNVADVLREPPATRTDIVRAKPPEERLPVWVPEVDFPREVTAYWARVYYSPDGKLIASFEYDEPVKIWDTSTGEKVQTLRYPGDVDSVVFSPDGRMVAAFENGSSKPIVLWEVGTEEAIRTLAPHDGCTKAVAFSPDGGKLISASGSDKLALSVWEIQTGRHTKSWQWEEVGWQDTAAFSPDGETIAAEMPDYTIGLFDVATGTLRRQLAQGQYVTDIAFSPNGTKIASASGVGERGLIRLWDVETGRLLHTLRGHAGGVRSIAFSPDGAILASAGKRDPKGESVKLWDVQTGAPARRLRGTVSSDAYFVVFSPDGKTLAFRSLGMGFWHVPDLFDDALQQAAGHVIRGGGKVIKQGPRYRVELAVHGRDSSAALAHLETMGKPIDLSLGRSLNLRGADLARLPAVTQLEVLNISGADRLTDADFAPLGRLARVQELRLADLPGVTDAGVAHVAELSQLKKLELYDLDELSDVGLAHLSGLAGLQELHLDTLSGISDEGLAHLKGLGQLRELNLSHAPFITNEGLAHLKAVSHLRELRLSDLRGVTDTGLANVAELTQLKKLELAYLEEVSKTGIAHLKGLTQLQDLRLVDLPGLTNAGLTEVSGLTQLKKLSVHNCDRITDAGLAHLKRLSSLQELGLTFVEVTDAGLTHLRELPNLAKLDVSYTEVTEEGIDGLRKALPNLEIVTE